jgi:hypothetical protein
MSFNNNNNSEEIRDWPKNLVNLPRPD